DQVAALVVDRAGDVAVAVLGGDLVAVGGAAGVSHCEAMCLRNDRALQGPVPCAHFCSCGYLPLPSIARWDWMTCLPCR
ncbi:MAG TPA: hypothetical protein VK832_18455, partial [Burkholderiaceae bacterium]|nr:hypothetical protein [Burkholderiaceae bacterium]